MRIDSTLHDSGHTAVIKVHGAFDFSLFCEFRRSYEEIKDARRFIVDLYDAEFMDCTALGMLLLLKEFATERGGDVALRGYSREFRMILENAGFHRIFNMDE